jgi:hypothetical protein
MGVVVSFEANDRKRILRYGRFSQYNRQRLASFRETVVAMTLRYQLIAEMPVVPVVLGFP